MRRRLAAVVLACGLGAARLGAGELPDILLLTVDTLRADRLGAYGCERATSPRIDALLAEGARFSEARTIEPLTAPALASMITSLHPHDHAATRNGLRMRSDLPSLPKVLARRGYETAAFVGNWTLRDQLLGMGEHFTTYEEVLERRRWLGLMRGEATAGDLNAPALAWVDRQLEQAERRPLF
ncbi:MAG: sulfatase-like hydrolase/transferase, partial [Thermoanaerobaculia bacterium]